MTAAAVRSIHRSFPLYFSIPEILALKDESRILGQWFDPVSGSRKSQASSPWAKQHGGYLLHHGETTYRVG